MQALIQRRHALGLTQQEIAERMGTSQSAVARAERTGHATDAFLERYEKVLDDAVLPLDRLQRLVQKHARGRVWLFGSYATGKADAQSDIDLIVENDPDLASAIADSTGKHVDAITTDDYERRLRPWVKVDVAQHNLRLA